MRTRAIATLLVAAALVVSPSCDDEDEDDRTSVDTETQIEDSLEAARTDLEVSLAIEDGNRLLVNVENHGPSSGREVQLDLFLPDGELSAPVCSELADGRYACQLTRDIDPGAADELAVEVVARGQGQVEADVYVEVEGRRAMDDQPQNNTTTLSL